MGIRGAGYATLIDRSLMAIVMGTYVFKSPTLKSISKVSL